MLDLAKNSETLRNAMVDAACELFTTIGYNETTVRMITAKAGVDSRSFNYLFGSKEDILESVIQKLVDNGIRAYEEISEEPGTPVDRIIKMIYRLTHFEYGRNRLIGLVKKRAANTRYLFRQQVIKKTKPFIDKLILEGIECGQIHTNYYEQTTDMLLFCILFTLDLMNASDAAEADQRFKAVLFMVERALGIEEGTLLKGLEPK